MKHYQWLPILALLFSTASAAEPLERMASQNQPSTMEELLAQQSPQYVAPKRAVIPPSANRPYTAMGRQYAPIADTRNFRQQGMASWYASDLEGKMTSSGERYDPNILTAAHPSLPIPCYVRVTNLNNGRTVVVKVNDHGPFSETRIINLSYLAAQKLDMIDSGMAEVEIKVVSAAEERPRATSAQGYDNPPAHTGSIRFMER
jgi:rare lipoprotein A